jgi:L-iditol 2-dehydrogenase
LGQDTLARERVHASNSWCIDNTMRAVIRTEHGVALTELVERAAPPLWRAPVTADDVLVDVAVAGVCRSDLGVADGSIPVELGRVLGHEMSGYVNGVSVTVIPFEGTRWLGIDRDGAFAERVWVPASCVLRLPASMSLVHAAYVEPVAAALATHRHFREGERVKVAGTNRIAELTRRIVRLGGGHLCEDELVDVAIEHDGDGAALVSSLRDGGTLVLKSRARRTIALPADEIVARELRVVGASHGSFAEAIAVLAQRRIPFEDLLAAPRPLEDFADVFASARSETQKQMFVIGAH